jgi:hypothetical protein
MENNRRLVFLNNDTEGFEQKMHFHCKRRNGGFFILKENTRKLEIFRRHYN